MSAKLMEGDVVRFVERTGDDLPDGDGDVGTVLSIEEGMAYVEAPTSPYRYAADVPVEQLEMVQAAVREEESAKLEPYATPRDPHDGGEPTTDREGYWARRLAREEAGVVEGVEVTADVGSHPTACDHCGGEVEEIGLVAPRCSRRTLTSRVTPAKRRAPRPSSVLSTGGHRAAHEEVERCRRR